jgi:cytochrome d ubiquinol oxidase subunit II
MDFLEIFMPAVWFVILALFLLLYVILDGFDLGVGILSLTSPSETQRSILMTSLGNVWDANETWLVLMGGALFGRLSAGLRHDSQGSLRPDLPDDPRPDPAGCGV